MPTALAAAAKFKKPVDPKYPYTAPDGRRLKYPHGDLRNLFEPSPDTRKAGSDIVIFIVLVPII